MNRLNLAGQNILSNPDYNHFKEIKKPVSNQDTPTSQSQYSYNQKYQNQSSLTNGLETTFTSIANQQTPMSYRHADQFEQLKTQRLSQIVNGKQMLSPIPMSKKQQMDQTASSNMSGLNSSYLPSIASQTGSNNLALSSLNRTERNYFQQLNSNLLQQDSFQDQKDYSMSNTQQRFIYSRNGSEKTLSNNTFYPQFNQQNQSIFTVNTKQNLDSILMESKIQSHPISTKYKVRSCVNIKSSTKNVHGDLTFQSQVQAVNEQIMQSPKPRDEQIQKKNFVDSSLLQNNNITPISNRREHKIHSSINILDVQSTSSIMNPNTSSVSNLKQIFDKKDILNYDNEILIQNKLNFTQAKDSSKILNASIQTDRCSQIFQQVSNLKNTLDQQQSSSLSSATLKNVFYQQLATNSHIVQNRKEDKLQKLNYNNSTNIMQNEYNNTSDIQSIIYKENDKKKIIYSRQNSNDDSDEDRRMYNELLELSPLPKSRKLDQQDTKNQLLIKMCKVDNPVKAEQNENNNKNEISNLENTTKNSKPKSEVSVTSERNIRKLSAQEQINITQKNNAAVHGSKSSINIKSIPKKESQYLNEYSLLEQAQTTNNFAIDYKKIDHIVDEAKHFNDKMDIGQAMLSTTITKNVLPRKLGIVANLNTNKKSINDAIKKRKKRQSFDANGSPLKQEEKGELPALLASQVKGKRVSEFMYNTNNDSSLDEQQQSIINQQVKIFTPISQKENKSFTPQNYGKQVQAATIKRNASLSQHLKKAPSNLVSHKNGLTENENKKPFDKVAFQDSNEIAKYLQKNMISSESQNDEENNQEEKQNLNLSRLQISKTYCEMLAQALKHPDFENLNFLNLQDNNLTGSALSLISQNLPKHLRKIDLSNNFLNNNDNIAICNILYSKQYPSLIYLNLSNNLLADIGLKSISASLQRNSTLQQLNLSHNKLTDLSSPYLKEILLQNSGIQELYLSWNKLSSKSGFDISIGLSNNVNIRVLDLSHNSLGQNPNLHCGKKLIESCTKLESGLIHFDLSYNLFTKEECKQIAEALTKNQKLYGFHFEGNESHATVDSKGFLYFPNEEEILQKHVSTHTLMRRDINSVKCLGQNKLQNFNCNVTDNCWICDGWQEIEFQISEGSSDVFQSEPAFLHLDFEDFQPMYMDRDPENPTRYFLRRMCPPNRRILFFFTNPCTKLLFESNDYEKIDFHVNDQNLAIYDDDDDTTQQSENTFSAHHLQNSKQRKFNVKYLDGTVMEYIVPTTVNVISTKLHQNIQKKKGDYEIQIKCLPRQEETYYKINYTNQWHRGISLFKSFIPDNPELEQKCFEDDWNNSKLQNIFQQADKTANLSECKRIILDQYPKIRVLYRYLSCFGIINDVFCVTLSAFAHFAQESKIIDNNLMRMRDVECIFIAASSKALKVKNYRAPEKTVIRSEFVELMGRLALDKFIRTKVAKTPSEALNLLLNNQKFLQYTAEYEDPQQWRNIRFWTKQCDEMMKRYINFIKTLWNEYSDSRKSEKRGAPSNQKTMSLQEFQDMVEEFHLKDSLLTERDVVLSYNLSLQTLQDEINSEKYMAMNFVEFLEGLARLAEFKSRTPVGERDEAYKDSEKIQIRLEYKIESLLECMSIKYQDVMKTKRKKQMIMLQKQLLQRSGSRLLSLKVKKSFIQFSQTELGEQTPSNKFASTVQRVVNTMSVINAFKSKVQDTSLSSSEILDEENNQQFTKNSFLSIASQPEINKMNSRQLQRIDSEMDEFEDEEHSFTLSNKKQKNQQKMKQQNEESQPVSLKNIEENN
ncbi:hypothetical protein TTHERM_00853020 (macronuclear) [Tetrahymena thermophila SB210]|uniref:Leucine Rich Repeat family protein n=1 Tax=Tetrahymena thermophila (strain SB210) TaxID=312017 RepID=Q24E38_TETTS|nr:hypothetical protein TTHERM_00853020 [Tetrahymena thermophila SB210]EAS06063.2 hypothetical protein TTHERM_00853020 [Tetrahymena thermophila SB210]|eukprot:XP_001026308.2 hypothetical protein TTHERM_00853020 [Tetrahymena thermophila SB210]